ncbi:hypothetical protein SLG_16600 [Sphingobium sp. SYK-6]|nr:hypothetical protein SLG_16600 [Sphingobium sp. SYK-6]
MICHYANPEFWPGRMALDRRTEKNGAPLLTAPICYGKARGTSRRHCFAAHDFHLIWKDRGGTW